MRLLFVLLSCLNLQLTPQYVKRIVDGDTGILFHIGIPPEERFRVLGVDTYEMTGGTEVTRMLARAGRDSTTAWLQRGPFTFTACNRDSFGRYLAWINRGTDSLHVFLIASGLGVPYR